MRIALGATCLGARHAVTTVGVLADVLAVGGGKKLGHPVPESNFVSEPNSRAPQQTQWYVPSSCLFQYLPVKAGSVPQARATLYCSGVSCWRHSASLFLILSVSCSVIFSDMSCLQK